MNEVLLWITFALTMLNGLAQIIQRLRFRELVDDLREDYPGLAELVENALL